jgi:putative ABC transport system substrate-binding protein
MKRREFITLVSGAASAWPVVAWAQQPTMPVVGFLHSASIETRRDFVEAFLRGLNDAGYAPGRNVALEYRWAENQVERLPAMAADLVSQQVAVIFAGGPPSAMAAKAATASIPIVFTNGDDPVKAGLVKSLNKPGGNVTGVNVFLTLMEGKRLGLLREIIPNVAVIGILLNPQSPGTEAQSDDVRSAASAMGQDILVLNASTEQDIHRAFRTLAESHVGALLCCADPFFNSRREQLVTLAAHYALPAIYELRGYIVAGGLTSYGTDLLEAYRQAGLYTGKILKGEKPADLPVVQSTKFEFVINLKTAKALGLTVPPTLLARADEVIE